MDNIELSMDLVFHAIKQSQDVYHVQALQIVMNVTKVFGLIHLIEPAKNAQMDYIVKLAHFLNGV